MAAEVERAREAERESLTQQTAASSY
jgi:hypothetical protein